MEFPTIDYLISFVISVFCFREWELSEIVSIFLSYFTLGDKFFIPRRNLAAVSGGEAEVILPCVKLNYGLPWS